MKRMTQYIDQLDPRSGGRVGATLPADQAIAMLQGSVAIPEMPCNWTHTVERAMCTGKTFLAVFLAALALTTGCATEPVLESAVSAAQIESARTRAEHEAIARIFEVEAASLTRKAAVHRRMAMFPGRSNQAHIPQHCAALEREYTAAAQQNLELAVIHRQLARDAAE